MKSALAEVSLPELISPYIKNLIKQTGGESGPIGRQFVYSSTIRYQDMSEKDPLIEEIHEVAPGVIHKYEGRVLWTISRFCATYCRFCTRGRVVGLPANQSRSQGETIATKPYLSEEDIKKAVEYIKNTHSVREVVLSGGDPFICAQFYLEQIVALLVTLQKNGDLDTIRIHTRAPITNPISVKDWHLRAISSIDTPHIVLHINHAAELTPEVKEIVDRLRKDSHAILLSQSVLLKGVNDTQDDLLNLFNRLVKFGIRPYYLHHNDPVYWAREFTVEPERAIKLWQSLRPKLSGLAASAKFVIDTPHGNGKVVIPDSVWSPDMKTYVDFKEETHTFF